MDGFPHGTLRFFINFFFLLFFLSSVFLVFNAGRYYIVKTDFHSIYSGPFITKQGKGSEIYSKKVKSSYQELYSTYNINLTTRSLPFMALLFYPLSLFNMVYAYKLFSFFNLAIILLLYYTTAKYYLKKPHKSYYLVLLPFVSYQLFRSAVIGQTSVILLFVVSLIYFFLKKKKDFFAGIASGLLLIKVQYVVIIPFILILSRKRGSYLKGLGLSIFVLLSASLYVSGMETLIGYPNYILSTESAVYGSRVDEMFSFLSLIMKMFKEKISYLQAFAVNGLFYSLLVYLFYKKHKKMQLTASFSLGVILATLMAVHVYTYDLVLFVLPTIFLLHGSFIKKGKFERYTFLSFSLFIYSVSNYSAFIFDSTSTAALLSLLVSLAFMYRGKIRDSFSSLSSRLYLKPDYR